MEKVLALDKVYPLALLTHAINLQLSAMGTSHPGRPTYPKEWLSMLAAPTPNHSLAWDVGTSNGQAAFSLGENYEQVIGTDMSESQLKLALQHP
ncbi:hypothetical protein ACFX2G_007068 [Malus domestica]